MRIPDVKDTNPKDLAGQAKAELWLIPPVAKAWLAQAFKDGARKYEPYNWREKGVRTSVYLSAAGRHIDAYLDGEQVAPDSKVHHLAHAMACLAILLDAEAQGNLVDDRPLPGQVTALYQLIKSNNEDFINGNS